MSELAINGGPKAVKLDPGDIFTWPIITEEDEEAILQVLRARKMSQTDITRQFEEEYAQWHGMKYALGHNTGTASLHAAMFGCGVGVGDEIICQSMTYWASALPAFCLGATVVFAEIDPNTLTLDPNDIEHRITERTKAIMAVHYCGYPSDMDADNSQYWIGQCFYQLEDIDSAEKAFRKVLRNYSHNDTKKGYKTPDAILMLGRIYTNKKQPIKGSFVVIVVPYLVDVGTTVNLGKRF